MSTDSAGRILDAVLTLLSQHGIGGVSMRAVDGVRCIDEVLQQQDIGIVESVQRGMRAAL